MTDPTIDPGEAAALAARRARIEQLQRRRANPMATAGPATGRAPGARSGRTAPPAGPRPAGGRRRRPHPAKNSRIGTVGVSLGALFGLVAAMGLSRPPAPTTPITPAATGTAAPAGPVLPGTVSPAAPTDPALTTSPATTPPIALTARPRVQVATQSAPAPTASTSGSR